MCTDVSPRELDSSIAVDVGQQTQTKALRVGWVGKSVDGERRLRRVEDLADALVQLVVRYGAPEHRFAIRHRLEV